jgi:molybdopterin-synthase adenylyltransferase
MQRDFSRQSFLGLDSEERIAAQTIGVIGLSGGGSHIVQQAAHIGFQKYVLADSKKVNSSNLNRDVLAELADARASTLKTITAERKILGLNPSAKIIALPNYWQAHQQHFVSCDIIIGCVDSFSERDQLDRFCRRFLIPYIDIGMDIIDCETGYKIVGQVAMSHPDGPCLRCMNIITESNLSREAEDYGRAGNKPQVVWPNGVLASTAIGLLMSLVTPWASEMPARYFEYNGNMCTLVVSNRWQFVCNQSCRHYNARDVGDPLFRLNKTRAA